MLKKKMEESMMEKFFQNRDALIDEYSLGKMSKTEFIQKNYAFIQSLNFGPFSVPLKDYKECLYNYQYYNILAKYANLQAQELETFDPKESALFKEEEFEYYKLKDEATLGLLELVNYENIEAYFLNLQSNRLCGQLFEIVFKDYYRAIFHSMSPDILKRLRKYNVFSRVYKDSVIHSYVNSVY
ncbi:MAG: hypothetical protein JXR88_04750 [Clostridia bacterium]|nr:hypothetical protein [Clostridia bacterium]